MAAALPLAAVAFAHPANVPSSQIKVSPDGTFVARIRFDAIAFASGTTPKLADDGEMNALLDSPEPILRASLAESARRFRSGFSALEGGTIDELSYPTALSVQRFLAGNPSPRLPVMLTATVKGHLPRGARSISFRYPETFDTVIQTVEFPYREPISEPVEPGHASSRQTIPTAEEVAATAASFRDRPADPIPQAQVAEPPATAITPFEPSIGAPKVASKKAEPPVTPKTEPMPAVDAKEPEPVPEPASEGPSLLGQCGIYLKMGFTHILPEGIDHILFVLGLFLLGNNTKSLLKQVTAFTVAHSLTLALATLDIVRLPGRVIEPLIAISIAFVAIENLFMKDAMKWRTLVVFLFGLVHGMGFAEVFHDAGLSGSGLVTALLSFNVGVELGQLSVIAMALGAVGWFRQDARYRKLVVMPASGLIAAVAIFWTIQRIWF